MRRETNSVHSMVPFILGDKTLRPVLQRVQCLGTLAFNISV